MKTRHGFTLLAAAFSLAAHVALAQVPQYGPNITAEQAKKALAAAEAEAKKNNWPVAIAVVDTAGMLVGYLRLDNTQTASVDISQDKAVAAAMFRRSTKAMQDTLAAGGAGLRFLQLRHATAVDGGPPSASTARSSALSASPA